MKRNLPAPLAGIFEAKRPTGVLLGTLVPIIAVYGGLIVPSLVFSALTGSHNMPPWMTVVAFGSILLILFAWLRLKEGRRFRTLGFVVDRQLLPRVMKGAGVGVGLATLSILLLCALGQAEVHWNGGALSASDWLMAIAWVPIFAVQGSGEEAAMRGLAMQAYARRFGVIAAIVLQAVLFAVLHGQNDGMGVLPVVNLLLVGIALGCWAVAGGSLWAVCAFHAAWNWSLSWLFGVAVSGQGGDGGGIFSVMLHPDSAEALTGGTFGIEGSLVVSVVLAALIAILVRPLLRVIREARAPQQSAGTSTGESDGSYSADAAMDSARAS